MREWLELFYALLPMIKLLHELSSRIRLPHPKNVEPSENDIFQVNLLRKSHDFRWVRISIKLGFRISDFDELKACTDPTQRVLKSNCCNDIYDPISKETKIPYLLLPRKIGKCSLFKCRFPKPRFLELQVLLVWWHVIPFDTWVVAWLEVLEHLRRQRKMGNARKTGGNDKHKNFPKWWKGMREGETLCSVIFDAWDTVQKSMMLVTCTLEVFHSAPCESFGRLPVQLFRPLIWRFFFFFLLTLDGFHPSDDDDLTCFFLHPRRWRCCSPKALKLSTTRIGYCRGRDSIGVAVAFVCTMRKAWKYGTVPKSKEVSGFNHFKFSMTWQKVSRRSAGRVGIRLIASIHSPNHELMTYLSPGY